jgi:Zn-finger nucleic acid-binding protein
MHLFSSIAHHGTEIQLDVCRACHVVWFDNRESLALPGLSWVALLRLLALDGSDTLYPAVSGRSLLCPRCKLGLGAMHNQTRTGRFVVHRCAACNGHLQSHVGLLAQWGYFRQALARDWAVLEKQGHSLQCQSCGAGLDMGANECAHCRTPAFIVDVARLAQVLQLADVRAALSSVSVPSRTAQSATWPCKSCGHPLDPLTDAACGQCQHPVLVTGLRELLPALDQAEQQLLRPRPPVQLENPAPGRSQPTEAQLRIDRVTSGFSSQGENRFKFVAMAFALFLLTMLGLVQCMQM